MSMSCVKYGKVVLAKNKQITEQNTIFTFLCVTVFHFDSEIPTLLLINWQFIIRTRFKRYALQINNW